MSDSKKITCNRCKFYFCTRCKREVNKCDCGKDDDNLGSIISEGTSCPGCKMVYMKDKGCSHVKCVNPECLVDFCFECSAFRAPTLAHGNHYHRPNCRFFSKYSGEEDKYSQSCPRCVAKKKLCDKPKDLRIPRKVGNDEV